VIGVPAHECVALPSSRRPAKLSGIDSAQYIGMPRRQFEHLPHAVMHSTT